MLRQMYFGNGRLLLLCSYIVWHIVVLSLTTQQYTRNNYYIIRGSIQIAETVSNFDSIRVIQMCALNYGV